MTTTGIVVTIIAIVVVIVLVMNKDKVTVAFAKASNKFQQFLSPNKAVATTTNKDTPNIITKDSSKSNPVITEVFTTPNGTTRVLKGTRDRLDQIEKRLVENEINAGVMVKQ